MREILSALILPSLLLWISILLIAPNYPFVSVYFYFLIIFLITFYLKDKYTQWKLEGKLLKANLLLLLWFFTILSSVASIFNIEDKNSLPVSLALFFGLSFGAFPVKWKINLRNRKKETIQLSNINNQDFKGYLYRTTPPERQYKIPTKDELKAIEIKDNFLSYLSTMDPYEFERLIAEVMKHHFGENAEVILTQSSRDKGVDIIINHKDDILSGRYIVQVKRYRNNVGEPELKQFLGTIHDQKAKGIFVTLSDFTEPAKRLAQEHNITLINGEKLIELIKKYKIIEIKENPEINNSSSNTPGANP